MPRVTSGEQHRWCVILAERKWDAESHKHSNFRKTAGHIWMIPDDLVSR